MPFKCRFYHGYGNFARTCKKKLEEETIQEKGAQWTLVQKSSSVKQGTKAKGPRGEKGSSSNPPRQNQKDNRSALKVISSQNNFEVLSIPEDKVTPVHVEVESPHPSLQVARDQVISVLEDGELPHSSLQAVQGQVESTIVMDGSPPTYAEMEKKIKTSDNSSSDEDHLEKSSKKGRKLQRLFGRKKLNISRCKEFKQL